MDTPPRLPGPRDLGPSVATLLRELGFTVWEQATASLTLVTGTWTGLTGEQFSFQYAHHHPAAGPLCWAACNMGALWPGTSTPAVCFASTQVRRLREVRLLLLGNHRFAQARAAYLLAIATTQVPAALCQ
jgi:hypothetical protein